MNIRNLLNLLPEDLQPALRAEVEDAFIEWERANERLTFSLARVLGAIKEELRITDVHGKTLVTPREPDDSNN